MLSKDISRRWQEFHYRHVNTKYRFRLMTILLYGKYRSMKTESISEYFYIWYIQHYNVNIEAMQYGLFTFLIGVLRSELSKF